MRLRNKPWVKEYLENNSIYLIKWDKESKINLADLFENTKQPVHLEIGCGKGNFITNHALKEENINFIGMEKEETVVGVALKKTLTEFKQKNREVTNLKYFNDFAEDLSDIFAPSSIDKIYLNFSDPWPKARHAKKRLTYRTFLDIYANIIKSNGILEFKTDNDGLFAFSLEEISENKNWELIYQTTDLYSDQTALKNNIPTEYETKFHNIGKNINKLIIKKTF
ncbi:tRNA (guanine-N(7)-)-methyltransferase [Mesoplasma entomophilum]|uniref:tRNA (guanine-N(7)-)-methyltransferase n=1 Tax=Mesoplasma entomophilum TaxID=2149 RepID=A0A3S5XYY0_9MOLU|nr:tRNA (guanosine(46)-N7)-methyltransferase TrmB [Mesoplasma entomophilum]ATQ35375.1 tRNA (guanosine(46)-N7)-methyltransferase TrmB [Mesoplasma entomophilum]ATZ19330.1 tRNA (guanine-N(7)-)-methyltransferase [Mesoplasma entomophilum]